MQRLKLHIASKTVDGTEQLWVTSDSTIILVTIEVARGIIRGFSCRLGPGVVAEMGETRNALTGDVYPALCVFTEDADHGSGPQQFISKHGTEWHIES